MTNDLKFSHNKWYSINDNLENSDSNFTEQYNYQVTKKDKNVNLKIIVFIDVILYFHLREMN